MSLEYSAAVLAIGTELTDGQVVDRNSAWISKKLTAAGLSVIQHRAVADDRKAINLALGEMSRHVSHLFVTGGLGPTSDDFTRDVLADYFCKPLEFDEPSWLRIVERFRARGSEARPIQRQQCYFPKTSEILENQAGTANAFRFRVRRHGLTDLNIYVMPGPPVEIEAVWNQHYGKFIEQIVPKMRREELYMFRTLGRGESEIAEIVEKEIEGKGIRVGYRASLPYVEVKLWFKQGTLASNRGLIDALEAKLANVIVTHGDEDLADLLIQFVKSGRTVSVKDLATRGVLESRLLERNGGDFGKGRLAIETVWAPGPDLPVLSGPSFDLELVLWDDVAASEWRLHLKNGQGEVWDLAVPPTSIYKFGTERGRRYFTEKVFQFLHRHREVLKAESRSLISHEK